jgi:hypothetical protein
LRQAKEEPALFPKITDEVLARSEAEVDRELQTLDRDRRVEAFVGPAVDDAEPSLADHRVDAEPPADQRSGESERINDRVHHWRALHPADHARHITRQHETRGSLALAFRTRYALSSRFSKDCACHARLVPHCHPRRCRPLLDPRRASPAFGGGGAGNFMTRLTAVCAGVFMLTSMSLAYLSSGGDRAMRKALAEEAAKAASSASSAPVAPPIQLQAPEEPLTPETPPAPAPVITAGPAPTSAPTGSAAP